MSDKTAAELLAQLRAHGWTFKGIAAALGCSSADYLGSVARGRGSGQMLVAAGLADLASQGPPTRPEWSRYSVVCKRGHLIEGDNLYVDPEGLRYCRACRLATKNAWRDRQPLVPLDPRAYCARNHSLAEGGVYDDGRCRLCTLERAAAWKRGEHYPTLAELGICRRGHDLTEGDAYISPEGHRHCRRCARDLTHPERRAKMTATRRQRTATRAKKAP